MAQHWNRNPTTKDYVMINGSPEQTDSLNIPAFHRLKIKRTQWLYAPDTNYGSDFYLVQKNRTASDASLFENLAIKSVAPLVEDGRADQIESVVTQRARNGVALKTTIKQSTGEITEVTVDPIGV